MSLSLTDAAGSLTTYRRALVTGGAGFIGSHICDALVDAGLEVVCVDDLSAGSRLNIEHLGARAGFRFVQADVADFPATEAAMAGVDVVFHNAACKKGLAVVDPSRDVQTNVRGTLSVLEAARRCGVRRIVHASTGSVYGEAVSLPQDEDHPLRPVSLYGIDKLAGESMVLLWGRDYGIETSVLRYFHVYGPRQASGDYGGVIAIFAKRLLEGRTPTIFGDGSQQRSFTYIGDVVRANLLAAIRPEAVGRVFNCASGLRITILELFDQLASLAGRAGVRPQFEAWTQGDIKIFDVSNRRIAELGMTEWTAFDRGLEETFAWFKTQHEVRAQPVLA